MKWLDDGLLMKKQLLRQFPLTLNLSIVHFIAQVEGKKEKAPSEV